MSEARLPNYEQAFAGRPAVYAAWRQLCDAVQASMDVRRYELATFAAARELRSTYCCMAHGRVLLDRFLDEGTLAAAAADHRTADLSEVDVAVMDLAALVARDATAVRASDLDRLRDLGLTDDEILDVILTAAIRCFFSTVLDATATPADASLAAAFPEHLRDALTLGRQPAPR